jgi:prophage DNA circulation protein
VTGFLQHNPIFCELSYAFAMDQYQRTGLDVLFYGQEHFDTLAILSQRSGGAASDAISEQKVHDLMKNQKLFSNRELMLRNLSQLSVNMTECEDYIQSVIDKKVQPDQQVARALNQCISQFSTDDMQVLEGMVRENFHDAVMVNTLAKLQHAQITLTEKLNNIFVPSINKGPSKAHHTGAASQYYGNKNSYPQTTFNARKESDRAAK